MQPSALVWTATTLVFAVVTATLHIESTELAPPAAILGEHQELVKTWSVFSDEPLEKLHIAVAGTVVVRYDATLRSGPSSTVAAGSTSGSESGSESEEESESDKHHASKSPDDDQDDDDHEHEGEPVVPEPPSTSPSTSGSTSGVNSSTLDASVHAVHAGEPESEADSEAEAEPVLVAQIVVSGNGTTLLDLVDVAPLAKTKANGIRVHFRNTDAHTDGYLLTHVILASPQRVRYLATSIARAVVVQTNVVLQDAPDARVRLSTSGDTHLLVPLVHDTFALAHLDLDLTGHGVLQFQAAALTLNRTLAPSIAGRGKLAIDVATTLEADAIEATLSGAGALSVSSAALHVVRLTTSVYGRATASFAVADRAHSDVDVHAISVAGAGAVYAGTMTTNTTKVRVRGAAQVYVRVRNLLHVDASFSGDVFYVGDAPTTITTHAWFWRTPVHAARHDVAVHPALEHVPEIVLPTYVAIRTKHALFAADPRVQQEEDTSGTGTMMALATTMERDGTVAGQGTTMGTTSMGAVVLFGTLTMLTVLWIGRAWRQRRARRQYQPLV